MLDDNAFDVTNDMDELVIRVFVFNLFGAHDGGGED